jgi:hypothetical protein
MLLRFTCLFSAAVASDYSEDVSASVLSDTQIADELRMTTESARRSGDPASTLTFSAAERSLPLLTHFEFGTAGHCNVGNLEMLAAHFDPFTFRARRSSTKMAAISRVQHHEFRLQASFPRTDGSHIGRRRLFPGGIHSAQIWSKEVLLPEPAEHTIYAIEVRMKIPGRQGMWPASCLYARGPSDGSEIDNPEFLIEQWQNQFDWTGFNHGPGLGADLYSITSNAWTWHPGLNFAADYHNYQTIWTSDAVYKYVDGTLVYAASCRWTASEPARLGVNLAVGSSDKVSHPGLEPTSFSDFPISLSLKRIKIWRSKGSLVETDHS